MEKHFKRSCSLVVTVILILLWGLLVGYLLDIVPHIFEDVIGNLEFIHGILLMLGAYLISCFVCSIIPDFDYWIDTSSKPGYLVFDLSETNRRILNKHFTVFDRNRRTIVLCDESGQRIPIRYNKEVLEFLDQFSPVTKSKAPRQ